MSLPDSNPTKEPLAVRLRSEAAEWDEGEHITSLLLEAAEAIEHLAAEVAALSYARRPRPNFDPRIDWPERYTDGPICA